MTPTPSLIGRDAEVALLESLINAASVNGGALVLFGEPGSGKSALLDVAGESAKAAGFRCIRVTGVEFQAAISYSAINQCFLPLQDELALLSDAHRGALSVALGLDEGTPPDVLLVSNAALSLLQAAARVNPICLIVDDLQWIDRSSAGVIGFVARRLSGSRVAFLASARTSAESFFDYHGLPYRVVGPMNGGDAAKLLASHYPTMAQRPMRRVIQESGGNPLALIELPRELKEAQLLGYRELPEVLQLGPRLQSVFEARLSDLPPGARRLLLLAALDATADIRPLQRLNPGSPIADLLAPAERAHMVTVNTASRRIVFRHPLIRSAIVGLSTTSERQEAHRALATVFADDPDRLAWHLAEATFEPDARVSRLLYESAQRTFRRGDTVGALTMLTRAADLSPHQSHRSRLLLEAAYLGSNVTGRWTSTSEWYDEAMKGDPDMSGSLLAAVTRSYLLLNGDADIDTIHRLLSGAIEARDATPHDHDDACLQAVAILFFVCFLGGRPEPWESFHAALERLGPVVPEEFYILGQLMSDPVRLGPAVLDRLDRAIAGLDENVHSWARVRANIGWLAAATTFVDRFSACRPAVWRVIEDGRRGEAVELAINVMQHMSNDDFSTGNWAESEQLAKESLILCRNNGNLVMQWVSYLRLALIAAGRGDHAACTEFVDWIVQWATPRGAGNALGTAAHAKGLLALGQGDYESAYEHFSAVNPPGVFLSHKPAALLVAFELVESAVRTNRLAEARSHVAAMEKESLGSLSARWDLVCTACAAMTASDEAAAELFQRALRIPGADRWQFEYARVQLIYGERLRRMKFVAESRRHLTEALDAFRRIGAEPWVTRAEVELRATGRTGIHRHAIGLESLTAQEREIAELAATGMSNKEIGERLFLSHRTVSGHLYRVFPKLGVTTRAGLRDALGSLATTSHEGPLPISAHKVDVTSDAR